MFPDEQIGVLISMAQHFPPGTKAYVFDDKEDVIEILGVDTNLRDNQGNNLLQFRNVDGCSSGSISPQALTILEESNESYTNSKSKS